MDIISDKKIVTNIIWNLSEKICIQIVSSIVSIVIARFIEPSAFGVVALATAVIAIFEVFADSGFANALIQKKNPDDLDYSTVFIANMVICFICYFIIYIASPLIGEFYNNSNIVLLLRVLGISVIVYGLKNVQHAYIAKNMIYKKFFFASLAGTIGSGIVGIFMAINGYEVWSLVISNLFDLIIDTIVIWFTIDWKPKLEFSFNRLKSMFNYGSKLLINSVLGVTYNKLYQFVIGKYYTTEDLAYYVKGEGLPTKLVGNVTSSLNNVTKPALANNQDDDALMKEIVKKTIKVSSYIMMPMLVGLSIVCEPLVKLVFTDKWLPIIPYVRIVCAVNFEANIININANVLRAKGRSDLVLKYCTIIEIFGLVTLFVLIRFGPLYLSYALLLNNSLELLLFSYSTKILINYSLIEQIKDISKYFIISSIMGVAVYCVSSFGFDTFITLFLQIAIGIIIYLCTSYMLKIDSFVYIIETIKSYFLKK